MLHTLCFSLQNAVYFKMLPFMVPVLFTFTYWVCQNLNVKLWCQKVKVEIFTYVMYVCTFVNRCLRYILTHCGRVTQICVFPLQLCRMGEADLRF